MKILYIFPHPDDESFGPAPVIHKQKQAGHDVCLLTLTKGGATKQRHKYNYSIAEMGEVRYKEMLEVAKALGLKDMTVLDLPDSGLKEMDPRQLEEIIKREIIRINPDVIVTYPVHGISGYHDHLVTHAVVKRLYHEMTDKKQFIKRLAFYTVNEKVSQMSNSIKLNYSSDEEIDCIIEVDRQDIDAAEQALDCYETYRDVTDKIGIREMIKEPASFEIYGENFTPPINDLFDRLPGS